MYTLIFRVRDTTGYVLGEHEVELSESEFQALSVDDSSRTGQVELVVRKEDFVGFLEVPAGMMKR